MNEASKKALIETLKTGGRFVWFGLVGLIVTALTSIATGGFGDTIGVTVFGQYMDITIALTLGAGFLAKALDRYVHSNRSIDANGLAPSLLQRKTEVK